MASLCTYTIHVDIHKIGNVCKVYILSNILFQVNSLINIYLILLLMVSKNVLNCQKKGGGLWHENGAF